MKQGIYAESEVAKYPIGLRFPLGDWVFRYCRAKTALILNKRGAGNDDVLHEENTAVVASAGDLDLTVIGNYTADQFKDGYINI